MPRLGVIGWPVAHSRSPAMFTAAFREYDMNGEWTYQRLPLPPELFEETVRALPGAGFLGANVTIPHKRAALALADSASPTTRAIGAANTLTFADDGSIAAENTDAPGLIAALGRSPAGMRALVLGAGGSARAAVWALLDAGAAVLVWNRTHSRARKLAGELGAWAVERPVAADLLVNCTSVGLAAGRATPDAIGTGPDAGAAGPGARPDAGGAGPDARSGAGVAQTPIGSGAQPGAGGASGAGGELGVQRSASERTALNQLMLDADQVGEYPHVVDLVYRNGDTPLIAAARSHGAHVVDGLEVLVAQGALSFELWTGRPAPLAAMRSGARIS